MSGTMPTYTGPHPETCATPTPQVVLQGLRVQQGTAHERAARLLQRRSRAYGILRLALFAAATLMTVRAATDGGTAAGVATVAGWLGFSALVVHHGRVLKQLHRARARAALAGESAARLSGESRGPGVGGAIPDAPTSGLDAGQAVHAAEPAAHAVTDWAAADLGLEGESPSLLELLDTTQSELGARRLRYMLRHPLLDAAAIRARQECVAELAAARALRDDLMLAFFGGRDETQNRLPAFLAAPRLLRQSAWSIAALGCGVTCLPALLLARWLPACVPLATASLAGVFLFRFSTRRRTALLRDAYLELEPLVGRGREVTRILAASEPRSAGLARLRDLCLEYDARGAPCRLQAVAWRLRMLHLQELGFLGSLLQLFTLWDVHWLVSLEARVKHAAGRYERLAGALADLEAHVALAVYADEAVGSVFPEILASAEARLEIVAGEHPLLPGDRAVANDVDLGGASRLAIVTGSNMAGKSTYLRMAALAVVLAQTGAPVRARAMRLTPLALHANINVQDSLADGKSYFLVEVERVRGILAAVAGGPAVLGVFDELFRGTNAHERLAASREIARHLAGSGGLFLLATHDQGLGRLAGEEAVPGTVALHFEDEIREGRMTFTYRVRPGVARTHNAIRLLEIAGYPPDLVARARAHAETAFGARGEGEGRVEAGK
jgi:hypothetical protein